MLYQILILICLLNNITILSSNSLSSFNKDKIIELIKKKHDVRSISNLDLLICNAQSIEISEEWALKKYKISIISREYDDPLFRVMTVYGITYDELKRCKR